jgi:nicotinamidase-related amidase
MGSRALLVMDVQNGIVERIAEQSESLLDALGRAISTTASPSCATGAPMPTPRFTGSCSTSSSSARPT